MIHLNPYLPSTQRSPVKLLLDPSVETEVSKIDTRLKPEDVRRVIAGSACDFYRNVLRVSRWFRSQPTNTFTGFQHRIGDQTTEVTLLIQQSTQRTYQIHWPFEPMPDAYLVQRVIEEARYLEPTLK